MLKTFPVPASDACDFFGRPRPTWYKRIKRGQIRTVNVEYTLTGRLGRPPAIALEAREIARLLDEEQREIDRLTREHAARRQAFEKAQAVARPYTKQGRSAA